MESSAMMPERMLLEAFVLFLLAGGYAMQFYSVQAYKSFVSRSSIRLNELCDKLLAAAR